MIPTSPVVELRKSGGDDTEAPRLQRHVLHGGPQPQSGEIPPFP